MKNIKSWIKREFTETRILLRSLPAIPVTLFVISIVLMNLLANKTIIDVKWLAADAGYLVSWMSFLTIDMVTKHFGLKAANKLAVFGVLINLLVVGLFNIVVVISGVWGTASTDAGVSQSINSAIDEIFAGTWFITFSSTVAFIVSSFVNNFLNHAVGRVFKKNPDSRAAYCTRTYVSTLIGQIIDNTLFSALTFMIFAPIFWNGFSWTFTQVLVNAILAGLIELVMEIIFSPIGYRLTKKWKRDNVGKEYLDFINSEVSTSDESC